MIKIVVLISGNGSNLQAIIDKADYICVKISAVISNKKSAFGLQRAKKAKINTEIVISKNKTRENFENDLIQVIEKYNPKLIILAGFMRILTNNFVIKFKGRMLNIHPSLLPKFKGLDTHKRAIESKEKFAGASVHIVCGEIDSGEIIEQISVKISNDDTVSTLAKKVLKQEHILYPLAIKKFIKKNYD